MADSSEPHVVIFGARRGRPPASEPRASLSTWVPVSDADRLIRMANARDQSVSALLRQILKRAIGRV